MKYNNDPFMEDVKEPVGETLNAPAEETPPETIADSRNEDEGDVDPAEPVEADQPEQTDAE
jgi:hypothetical protein